MVVSGGERDAAAAALVAGHAAVLNFDGRRSDLSRVPSPAAATALLFMCAKVQTTEEAGQLCTCECVREGCPPRHPLSLARPRRRHEYLMRSSVFMRLEDGAKRREAERDRGGGGKWDGGRFKSYDNGARFPPWPSSCESLNVIMTTKVRMPAHLPAAAAEGVSLSHTASA